jgi:hypothetical protein
MDSRSLAAVLNHLLRAEAGTLLQRLAESNVYSAWSSAADRLLLERMVSECRGHQQALAALILKLRGVPQTPWFPTEYGGVHYLDLTYLMPRVLEGVRSLIREYEASAGTGHAEADALLARHLSDHRRHLAELEKMHTNQAGAAVVR